MGIEQRKFPRLEEEFPIRFEVVSPALPRPLTKPVLKGVVKNISGGGLYVVVSGIKSSDAKRLLDHRLRLSVEFFLPDFKNRVKAIGDVQWIRKESCWWRFWMRKMAIGIKFTCIQPEDRDCIIKYVINKQIEDHLVSKNQ